jgi:hypothetical protein
MIVWFFMIELQYIFLCTASRNIQLSIIPTPGVSLSLQGDIVPFSQPNGDQINGIRFRTISTHSPVIPSPTFIVQTSGSSRLLPPTGIMLNKATDDVGKATNQLPMITSSVSTKTNIMESTRIDEILKTQGTTSSTTIKTNYTGFPTTKTVTTTVTVTGFPSNGTRHTNFPNDMGLGISGYTFGIKNSVIAMVIVLTCVGLVLGICISRTCSRRAEYN